MHDTVYNYIFYNLCVTKIVKENNVGSFSLRFHSLQMLYRVHDVTKDIGKLLFNTMINQVIGRELRVIGKKEKIVD